MVRLLAVLVLAGTSVNAQTYTSGDWQYTISNGEATITGYTGSGGAVAIPSEVNGVSVTSIRTYVFNNLTSLTSITIPNSVTSIGPNAFFNCTSLTSITMPDRFIVSLASIGITGQVATDYIINALSNNDAFVTAVANKILAASNNYGLATQSGVSNTITATTSNLVTQSQITTLATKNELTNALAQSRTDGINSVLSNPNLWTLYTTSQIQGMAIGDLVLTRTNGGGFVLNYDIEQSEDLVNWTPYQGFAMPLTNLPTNKAFVRIKAKQ